MTLLRAIVYFIGMGDEVKQKAEAILLAKEAIDIVYNQRDTNLRRSVRRDCAHIDITKPDACWYTFTPGSVYRVEFNWYSGYTIVQTTGWDIANTLYAHTVNWVQLYTHTPSSIVTPFKRYVEFSQGSLWWTGLSTDHALKMTVYIQYIRGTSKRNVILESFLAAWEKDQ